MVEYAFATLSDVAQTRTQWTIVYDLTGRTVHFRTKDNREIKSVRAAGLDFSCRTGAKLLDIQTAAGGDVTDLVQPYTLTANRNLIYRAFRETDFLKGIPGSALDAMAALPETFACCRPNPWRERTRTQRPHHHP
jgi:hypothetical protein